MEKIITLDCEPGNPRPGDLIDGVVEGTGLVVEEPVSTLFGNWTWRFDSVSDEKWKEAQKTTEPRIRDLHKKGVIRYGSW